MLKNRRLYLTQNEMASLSRVALGLESADLVVQNARLINVYTGEIQDGQNVCVKGRAIACVGPDIPDGVLGQETKIVRADGKTLVPGFIDGHAHLAFWSTTHEFLRHAMKGGTTTIITESLEVLPVGGFDGVLDFLESLSNQPIKLFATIPPMVSISKSAVGVSNEIMETLARREDVVGMGESYWQNILQAPEHYLSNYEIMLRQRKPLEGHSAGAKNSKLNAYTAMGFSSCHEAITAEEALERLRLGLYVMIREGSIRRDLKAVSKLLKADVDTRRLILTTDGVCPADLADTGYLEYPVQKAIDYGFDPVCAIQMATLNVAEHFGLDHVIGGIAPGKAADMVLIPDPETIKAQTIISSGRIILKEGDICVPPRNHTYSALSLDSIKLDTDFNSDDFKISVPDPSAETARVRIIEMVTDLVTKETVEDLKVFNGEIPYPEDKKIIKISAIDRTFEPGKMFTGLLKGFGQTCGAFASSAAWDTSCIIAAGADDEDMAAAVNRVRSLKGGIVVCKKGRFLFELPLPVFGIISDLPIEDIAGKMDKLKQVVQKLGLIFPDPALTLDTMTGAAIPYLRICEHGLVNLKDGKTKGLFV